MWLESLYLSSKNFATWSILFRYTALLPGIGFRRPVIQPHSLTFAGEAHGDDVRGDVGEVEVVAVHLEEMFSLLARNANKENHLELNPCCQTIDVRGISAAGYPSICGRQTTERGRGREGEHCSNYSPTSFPPWEMSLCFSPPPLDHD